MAFVIGLLMGLCLGALLMGLYYARSYNFDPDNEHEDS